MKQITLVLHYDDDSLAEAVYASLIQIKRHEPDQNIAIFGEEIVDVKIKGPND